MARSSKKPVDKGEPKLIAELPDSNLEIWEIHLDDLKEQDRNAQTMPPEMLERLAANIKKEQRLESFPLAVRRAKADGTVYFELVSGHHRTRAARMAGVNRIYVLADPRDLSRSKVVAKQLAHNSINGMSDADVLKQLFAEISDVEDMFESYIDPENLDIPVPDSDAGVFDIVIPHDWRSVTFTFLPKQMDKFDELVAEVKARTDDDGVVGVVDAELFERFKKALQKAGAAEDVRSTGTVVSEMVKATFTLYGESEGEDETWVSLAEIFGAHVPPEVAELLRAGLEKMLGDGDVTPKAKWRAVELLMADYLAG